MKHRQVTPEDMPIVRDWYVARGWFKEEGLDHFDYFPEDGVIVELNGVPLYAGWLYLSSNSKVAWMDWLIGNPNVTNIKALKLVVKALEELAKKKKVVYLLSAITADVRFKRFFESLNFTDTNETYFNFIKKVE